MQIKTRIIAIAALPGFALAQTPGDATGARIQRMEDKAHADGKISREEARRIEHAQDQQNKAIARERNDKQRAK